MRARPSTKAAAAWIRAVNASLLPSRGCRSGRAAIVRWRALAARPSQKRCLVRAAPLSVASPYPFVGRRWTTAMPYGLLPVAMVAVVLKVLWSMTDSVFAPWLAT
jgi:hypothetical protein